MIWLIVLQAPNLVGLETPVSYSQPAKSIPALLADLSKTANVSLAASPEAAKEVVLVSVKSLPLKSLMDKIAQVTSCEWKQSGDTYTLEPDSSKRTKEEAEETENRILKVKKAIQLKLQHLVEAEAAGKKKPAKATDQPQAPLYGITPEGDEQALTRLLQWVDPAQLAQALQGKRMVWATNNSTKNQLPLTGKTAPIIKDWIAAHNAHKVPDDDSFADDFAQVLGPSDFTDIMKAKEAGVKEPVVKTILIAQRMPLFNVVQISAKGFNAKGKVVLSGVTMLDSSYLDLFSGVGMQRRSKAATSGTMIQFSDRSQGLFGLLSRGGIMPPPLKPLLMHPELDDPLSFMATDAILSVAKKKHLQLVADLPDSAYGGMSVQISTGENWESVDDVERSIAQGRIIKAQEDGQLLCVMPANPAEARLHRTDRSALRTFLQAIETKTLPSLDDYAEFALTSDDPITSSLLATYFWVACPGFASQVKFGGGQLGWPLYRAYGSLSPTQRQNLRAAGTVPFSALNSTQQDLFWTYLNSPESSIETDGSAPWPDIVGRMMNWLSGARTNGQIEPTEAMLNGLPPDGFLSCGVKTEPVVLTEDGNEQLSDYLLGPDELAIFRAMSKPPAKPSPQTKLPQKGFFGSGTVFPLKFHVGAKVSASGRLDDPSMAKSAPLSSILPLPKEFEAKVQAALLTLERK